MNFEPENDHSLAQRRTRRKIQLPSRLKDFIPSSLPELPTEHLDYGIPQPAHPEPLPFTRRIINTTKNVFGLFRRYARRLPNHDPEELVDLASLTDLAADHIAVENRQGNPALQTSFYPFPNKSSFQLSEWYWSDGAQKSQSSFKKMVNIVGSPDFKPEDVKDTKWDKMNTILGQNDFDKASAPADDSFLGDGAEDAGWRKKAITITVPFHRRSKTPGPKEFQVGDFYHRSLIAVLREKLANSEDDQQFHYQPFELRWQPDSANADADGERVYGELYTSPAFLEAHNELQEAPGEPGCTFERVVAGLMFSSDATQLTTFGTAKLWPCYMYFGNESKYRRCKPTCKLCNHVAYFQTVRVSLLLGHMEMLRKLPSSLITSKTLLRSIPARVALRKN